MDDKDTITVDRGTAIKTMAELKEWLKYNPHLYEGKTLACVCGNTKLTVRRTAKDYIIYCDCGAIIDTAVPSDKIRYDDRPIGAPYHDDY